MSKEIKQYSYDAAAARFWGEVRRAMELADDSCDRRSWETREAQKRAVIAVLNAYERDDRFPPRDEDTIIYETLLAEVERQYESRKAFAKTDDPDLKSIGFILDEVHALWKIPPFSIEPFKDPCFRLEGIVACNVSEGDASATAAALLRGVLRRQTDGKDSYETHMAAAAAIAVGSAGLHSKAEDDEVLDNFVKESANCSARICAALAAQVDLEELARHNAKTYSIALERLAEHHRVYDYDEHNVQDHIDVKCFDLEAGFLARQILLTGESRIAVLKHVAAPFLGKSDVHHKPSTDERVFADWFQRAIDGKLYDKNDAGSQRESTEALWEHVRDEALDRATGLVALTLKALSRIIDTAIWMHSREEDDDKNQNVEEAVGSVAAAIFEAGGEEEAQIFIDGLRMDLEKVRRIQHGGQSGSNLLNEAVAERVEASLATPGALGRLHAIFQKHGAVAEKNGQETLVKMAPAKLEAAVAEALRAFAPAEA